MGRVDVRVVAARNLADTQWVSKPDPYCVLRLERQQHKTTVKENNLNPEWNEVFKFTIADEKSSQLIVEVWNKNVISDELMGTYRLSLSGLTRGVVSDQWYLLQNSKKNSEIRLRVMAHDFGRDPPSAQSVAGPSTEGTPQMPYQGAYPSPQPQPPAAVPSQQAAPFSAPVNPMPMYGPPQTYACPPTSSYYPQAAPYGAPQPQPYGAGYPPQQPQAYGAPPPQPMSGGAYGGYPPAPGMPPFTGTPVMGVPLGFNGQPSAAAEPSGTFAPPLGYPQAPSGVYPPPQHPSYPPAMPPQNPGYPPQKSPAGFYYS
mmetsp:Transcript_31042/g.35888  ORF Transcript_31042/g.35888 Transcript_31042/m.35888 type:complete len:314 (-) Transcript_31042:309-1250(-)|eukprot:CAMPEP_0176461586 /NCGR_PEP_ID=MMETSP0127-20121128/34754_1 /TAXON_ID=938130 /ORGANISM="Platyophrya macrostoma, Strain WH" /LENGTH=313 /DNA_ID=CAMNT_0017853329 /DNA_START=125 /DNA_END=1066 /DNA_ORIENTATION=+